MCMLLSYICVYDYNIHIRRRHSYLECLLCVCCYHLRQQYAVFITTKPIKKAPFSAMTKVRTLLGGLLPTLLRANTRMW